MPGVRFGVLGPLEAEGEHGPIDLKGRRHRAVLARLLIARGQVVPVARLIDDLWGDAPEGATGAIQTFVGALRKALEPDRPARTPARLLVTLAPGYAVRVAPDAVDAWRFEAAVADSASLLVDGRAEQARTILDGVLGLWRGPPYAEFADEDWARGEVTRLDELRLLAVERRAEAALATGDAAALVPGLEAHVDGSPLREDGWRLLAVALYRAGRQGDALAALRRARRVLRDELGVDPGPGLRRLEAEVLAQAPELDARSGGTSGAAPATAAARPPAGPKADSDATPTSEPRPGAGPSAARSGPPSAHPFVGRDVELELLEQAAATVVTTGRPQLALLSGVAGAGKTTLARVLTERLEATGWLTAWGTSPEFASAPTSWPWTQMLDRLAAAGHGDALADVVAGPHDDPVEGRFLRHRAIRSGLAKIGESGPVLLVFDDLHWADEDTLSLLTALAAAPDAGPVLLVGTYRTTEIAAGLTEALGRAARAEPTRIYLGGLAAPQIRELVVAIAGREMAASDAALIHVRSAGNPFFVRELVRLWETEGDAALHAVPSGVRDVVRHRLTRLDEAARTHLQQAAVLGQEIDLDLLIALAGDEDAVLASVESALLAGFLVESDGDRLGFAHALVHETLYDDLSRVRRAATHAAVAAAIETARPDDVEAIAHHLLRAGSRVAPARVARFGRLAAERAEQRFASHEAARLWQETIAALDRAGEDDARARLEAVMGMVRALAVTGDLRQARRHRTEAIAAAELLGDPVLTAELIGSFDVPAIWTTNDDPERADRLVAAAERTLDALPADREGDRARLLATIAIERRADAGGRGGTAAGEAEAIARRLGDVRLLAFALDARFMQTFDRAGMAPQRAEIGQELLDLATRDGGLVTFEVLGHLILIQARAALADLAAADHHAAAVDRLAARYELPVVGVFTDWYGALRMTLTGRADQARRAYRQAAARLSGTGMSGIEQGILPLALLCLDERSRTSIDSAGSPSADRSSGPTPDETPEAEPTDLPAGAWGPYEPWARPLVLLARGERDQAQAAARAVPESPHDLLLEARAALHATAAIEVGDGQAIDRLYAQLLPAADELAGAGSGLVTLGPVALYLGRLAEARGQHQEAIGHYRQARVVADRAGSPEWGAAASDALRRLARPR